jgi:ribosomal protein S18 acetylase RimI-like enzyme
MSLRAAWMVDTGKRKYYRNQLLGQKSSMEHTLASFSIRAGELRDIPAIAGLLDVLNQFEGIDAKTNAGQLQAALFAPTREVKLAALVAAQHEVVVGTLLYYPGYDTLSASVGYHLADMVVAQEHRRLGVGRALVKALATQTLNQGKAWVSLTALSRNPSAQEFYQSLGMTRVDVDFFAIGKIALAQL